MATSLVEALVKMLVLLAAVRSLINEGSIGDLMNIEATVVLYFKKSGEHQSWLTSRQPRSQYVCGKGRLY